MTPTPDSSANENRASSRPDPFGSPRPRKAVWVFIFLLLSFLAVAPAAQSNPSTVLPVVDPTLHAMLSKIGPTETVPVIVSFWRSDDRVLLDGFVPHHKFRALPMAGASLTAAKITALSTWTEVRSIWYGLHKLPLVLAEGRELVQAPQAEAAFGVTGAGITVAVIDTGVDTLHPDFSAAGLPPTSRARNIEVDLGPEGTCTFADAPNTDDIGHGTHVAGTIAGNGALSGGRLRGIAPDARIVMYDTNAGLFIILFEAICAYDDIIVGQPFTGIRHISNSWGGGTISDWNPEDPIELSIRAANAHGIVSVFAAGNSGPGDNTMSRQSASPYAISVAAITKKSQIVGFSSRGRPLDWRTSDPWPTTHDRVDALEKDIPLSRPTVSAPGVRITAPVPCSPACTQTTGYGTMSGTSMATPHVSGVLALVFQANPLLTPLEIARILEGTPSVLLDWLAWETGAGLVNALQAVDLAARLAANSTTPIPPPIFDESLNAATTTSARVGPVMMIGSARDAEPGSCPTPSVCRDFFVTVPTNTTRLLVRTEWTVEWHNFYAFAFGPGQPVTDFPTQEDTGLLDVPLLERILDIRTPGPGEWRIRILPRLNTVDFVSLEILISV